MSSLVGTYASGSALLEALHSFLIKGHTLRPQYSGVGNGYSDDMLGTVNSVHEVITITLTSATTFTVNGSASGVMGSGTVGTLFVHDRFTFTLVQGTTNFASGDSIVVQMTAPWTILAYSSGQSYFYQAPGDDGNQEVNVGWSVKSNVTGGYFNARVGAYPTWFSATSQWRKQDVAIWPLGSYLGSTVKLWASVSGQYIYAVARIGTVYTSMCVGYFDSIHSYDQYPAPYIVGGSIAFNSAEPADTSTTWAYNGTTICSPAMGAWISSSSNTSYNGIGSASYVRYMNNNWVPVNRKNGVTEENSYSSATITPLERSDASQVDWRNCARNLDDSYPLYPIAISIDYSSSTSLDKKFNLGYIPRVYKFPVYDKNGIICTSETTFRDNISRINFTIVNVGTNVSDTLSYYALEMV